MSGFRTRAVHYCRRASQWKVQCAQELPGGIRARCAPLADDPAPGLVTSDWSRVNCEDCWRKKVVLSPLHQKVWDKTESGPCGFGGKPQRHAATDLWACGYLQLDGTDEYKRVPGQVPPFLSPPEAKEPP